MKKPNHPERRLTSSLPERLKTETRGLHMQVERSTFMNTLLRSKMNRRSYAAMLRNLYEIYAALEPALERHAGHASIAAIHDEGLFRAEALARDLDVVHGLGWRGEIAVEAGAVSYVERLAEIERESPDLLVAHAYVRYLGDLSGGQLLRRIAAETFQLRPPRGTAFYDFGDAAQTARLTEGFRSGLSRVSSDPERIAAIVAEAVSAFERHRVLFEQLAAACGIGSTTRAGVAGH